MYGDVVTFNERLTAIGGVSTRKVEVYEAGIWNDQKIPSVGNKDGGLTFFTSLAIESLLYVFGNISVYYNISRLKFLLKLNYFFGRWNL